VSPLQEKEYKPGMVVLASNPIYLGGEGRRILNLMLAQAKKMMRPYIKKEIQAIGLGVWLKKQSTCLACARP
jgi:hypothetical protein